MNINDAYPSNYLKASDLQGKQPTVTIDRVVTEEVGRDKEHRPVIYFSGKEKGMVLNKTNANTLASVFGPETDGWAGRPVTLFTIMTEFNRQMVEALRLRPAQQAPQQFQQAQSYQQQPAPAAPPPQQPAPRFTQAPAFEQGGVSDDIPF